MPIGANKEIRGAEGIPLPVRSALWGRRDAIRSQNRSHARKFEASIAKMSIGVPIKVLRKTVGHIVTCEMNTGDVYRRKLIEAEDA